MQVKIFSNFDFGFSNNILLKMTSPRFDVQFDTFNKRNLIKI